MLSWFFCWWYQTWWTGRASCHIASLTSACPKHNSRVILQAACIWFSCLVQYFCVWGIIGGDFSNSVNPSALTVIWKELSILPFFLILCISFWWVLLLPKCVGFGIREMYLDIRVVEPALPPRALGAPGVLACVCITPVPASVITWLPHLPAVESSWCFLGGHLSLVLRHTWIIQNDRFVLRCLITSAVSLCKF